MANRIFQYLLTILAVLTLNFFLPRMMPGDPLSALMGDPMAETSGIMTEEARAHLLHYYNLDASLGRQYLNYLWSTLRGEFGWSIYFNAPVASLLKAHIGWTLLLMGVATLLYVLLGTFLGAVSAQRRGTPLDLGLMGSVFALGSWPPFFLALLLIIFFSVRWGLFPIGGAGGNRELYATGWAYALAILHHMVLPCLALVLTQLPSVYLLVRNSMVGVLSEDYVRTATAKGLRRSIVLWRHALPNALLPLVTFVAMRFGFLIMGTVTVEVVFSYPGMGSLLYEAFSVRDYPLLQGAFLLIMILVLCSNLAAELLYARLDPRVGQLT